MTGAVAQGDFAAALLDPARPAPAGLVAWNGSDPARRFAVHRNNVVLSLVQALAETFPVIRAVLGDGAFGAIARAFVAAQPPRSPVLAHYGDGFAEALSQHEAAAGQPWLADLARLEWARVRAFHATDAPSLGADAIAAQLADPARLPQARLWLHPSVGIVGSRFAIVSLWAAHQGPDGAPETCADEAEAALVLRIDDDVAVLSIPAAAAAFVRALRTGETLGDAAAVDPDLDLGAALALLIRHGAIVAWSSAGEAR